MSGTDIATRLGQQRVRRERRREVTLPVGSPVRITARTRGMREASSRQRATSATRSRSIASSGLWRIAERTVAHDLSPRIARLGPREAYDRHLRRIEHCEFATSIVSANPSPMAGLSLSRWQPPGRYNRLPDSPAQYAEIYWTTVRYTGRLSAQNRNELDARRLRESLKNESARTRPPSAVVSNSTEVSGSAVHPDWKRACLARSSCERSFGSLFMRRCGVLPTDTEKERDSQRLSSSV